MLKTFYATSYLQNNFLIKILLNILSHYIINKVTNAKLITSKCVSCTYMQEDNSIFGCHNIENNAMHEENRHTINVPTVAMATT